jgi:hercynylcysteine S-oxide lyase
MDTAAAGRSSAATLAATAEHAQREAIAGAYVVEAEVAEVLAEGRAALAGLLGLEPEGLAFTESGTASLAALLQAWPLEPGDVVAVTPSEWGPNLLAFASRGLRITELAVLGDGTVDLDELRRFVSATPPAFVHLCFMASHRPLVQPVAAVAAICQEAGVPLWADAAQALGHVETVCGADAIYSISRKWLTGPRGVGMAGVARPWWDKLRLTSPDAGLLGMTVADPPSVRLESFEAHVAGRIGLCNAVAEYLAAGPAAVHQRLADVGDRTRSVLGELDGWEVVAGSGPSAITTLRPRRDQDVVAVRARLLTGHGIVTTAAVTARAPLEMTQPLLRVSPHVDCTAAELELLRDALSTGT